MDYLLTKLALRLTSEMNGIPSNELLSLKKQNIYTK